jgi:hypothetical protein
MARRLSFRVRMRSSAHRAAGLALLLFGLMAMVSPASEAAGKPRLPKGVKAVRLGDGGYDVTAKRSATLPSGDRVVTLDARGLLEEAATRLCPGGHDLETDGSARLSVDPSGNFTTTVRGTVRCREATSVDALPQAP